MIADKIIHHYPDAIFSMTSSDDYSTLQWGGPGEKPTLAEINALPEPAPSVDEMWQAIQKKREQVKYGGVAVDVEGDTKWFHTDDPSRIQQIGLVIAGTNLPPVQWKTMDGSFVGMTPALAQDVFNAVANHDVTVFAIAENHRAAMEQHDPPHDYDYSGNWPQTFLESIS